jgi:CYTH domain-containing protein
MSDNVEIERKFLVADPVAVLKERVINVIKITQGYLARNDGYVVRIRASDDGNSTKGYITVKSKNVGITRSEYEYEIPYADAVHMLHLAYVDSAPIRKTRYVVLDQHSQQWDVDFFSEKYDGTILAEIELPSESTEVVLPSWIGQEVSDCPKYYNSNM